MSERIIDEKSETLMYIFQKSYGSIIYAKCYKNVTKKQLQSRSASHIK